MWKCFICCGSRVFVRRGGLGVWSVAWGVVVSFWVRRIVFVIVSRLVVGSGVVVGFE